MASLPGARRAAAVPPRGWRTVGRGGVSRMQLIVFSRQMATFIRAGIPILDGIGVIRAQVGPGEFRSTLDDMATVLRDGEPLSAALARHPLVFPRLYGDMVVAAEATGELDVVLEQLARYLDRAEATRRRIRQAMLYPSLVLGLATVVVFVLITFVLPSFVNLFNDFQAELPLPTRVLLAIGGFGRDYGLLTGALVALAMVGLFLVRGTAPVRGVTDRLVLRIPAIGRLVRLAIETRFARTLAILLRAGVPVVRAFDIVRTGTGNRIYEARLSPVREQLLGGAGITTPLAQTGLFSPLLIQMLKVGEETGTLDTYLEQAADFLDEDLDYRTRQMVTLIEPLMIVGVAAVVGFVALSVVTPMYGILQSIR
jgi:type IV pilus assembly protein PilC